MRKQTWFSVFGLAVLLMLSGCSFVQKPAPDASGISDEKVSETETPAAAAPEKTGGKGSNLKANTTVASKGLSREKTAMIRRYLNESDYSAALSRIQNEISAGTPEKELRGVYLRALNGAINQGRTRLEQNRPAQAGLLFRAALSAYPRTSEICQKVLLTADQLESRIALCAEKLMEQGLSRYREGHLDAAIDLWQKILAFDPHHQASRSAIQTAHIQINNLEKITDESK